MGAVYLVGLVYLVCLVKALCTCRHFRFLRYSPLVLWLD